MPMSADACVLLQTLYLAVSPNMVRLLSSISTLAQSTSTHMTSRWQQCDPGLTMAQADAGTR